MCHAACLWARCSFVFFAARHEDVMEHGKFDDVDFAAEIARRVEEKREMEEKKDAATKSPPPSPLLEIARPLLREEALVVWREYAARSDNVHY
jgi:tRNA(Arg) A34 adenosine deaminase TadA